MGKLDLFTRKRTDTFFIRIVNIVVNISVIQNTFCHVYCPKIHTYYILSSFPLYAYLGCLDLYIVDNDVVYT